MTLDRIRELLQGNDVGDLGDGGLRFVDIDTLSEYLRLTVPILRRWTDPTPITPEALDREGWKPVDAIDGAVSRTRIVSGLAYRVDIYSTGSIWLSRMDALAGHSICPLGTMGQLNRIVEAIEGVR